MNESWANRQRRTNRLVRTLAKYIFANGTPTSDQLYGLCKLTWITSSYDGTSGSYIMSTKIPALSNILNEDLGGLDINQIASKIGKKISSAEIKIDIIEGTGFTNFYKAFRNSSRDWIKNNRSILVPLFKEAMSLSKDSQATEIISQIEKLPKIPKANHKTSGMEPQ